MLSHESVWSAIDGLARRNGLTPSGLARRAGLDPTTFNPSKRVASDGRPRWPSMESIAKILTATRSDLAEFVDLIDKRLALRDALPQPTTATVATAGFFNDEDPGLAPPWAAPGPSSAPQGLAETPANDMAIRVSGDMMLPLYRDGDVVVVSPAAEIRKGDRVAVRTVSGRLTAHIFERRTRTRIDLKGLDDSAGSIRYGITEIVWMARIIWASQ
ncbi:S24 family peptidase [Stappia sp.]|jgi:phage repressor protein C with HTH and peptisase S24 domain|uniref:S24 family peptidase n=1 Tax=Stappia sp. TaxID=1870903 RepID=UPI003A9A240C